MDWEPDVGFDPGSPGSRPGPKAGAKPLHHPGIPVNRLLFPEYLSPKTHHPFRDVFRKLPAHLQQLIPNYKATFLQQQTE